MATREPIKPLTPQQIHGESRVMTQNIHDILLDFVNQSLKAQAAYFKEDGGTISVYPNPQNSGLFNLWIRWINEIRAIYAQAGWKVLIGLHDVPYEKVSTLEFSL